jgi:sugar O-acyltransferase (sialic acid O-acetyltransferase NeuD family)
MAPDPTRRVALIGGGGHALVVADAIADAVSLIGFFDDRPDAALAVKLSVPHLGPLDLAAPAPGISLHLALGDLARRAALLPRLDAAATFTIVHRSAAVSSRAGLGRGVFVGPQAVVHTCAAVGDHVIINSGAIVEHECALAPNVHVAPGAVLGGNVRVGTGTLVGLGARVLPGVTLGAGCVIGAGAVVLRDVPDGGRVMGVPARERA